MTSESNPTMSPKPDRRRFQFRLRTLLLLTLGVGVVVPILQRCYQSDAFHEGAFLAIVMSTAVVFRVLGAALGGLLGSVGRHAVAWFGAIIGFSLAVMALNFAEAPDLFLRDLSGGLLARCLIYGIFFATILEGSILLFGWMSAAVEE